MNVVSIEVAQPAFNPKGLARTGAVSLPALSAKHPVAFLSLMNRLLEPTGTATFDVPPVLAAKRVGGATLFPEVATEKQKGQKIGNPGAELQTAPFCPSAFEANAETPVPIQSGKLQTGRLASEDLPVPTLGGTQGSQAQPQLLSLKNFLATGIAPGYQASSVSVSAASDVAFALQLTWQHPASASGALAANAESHEALPEKISPGNSNQVLRPSDRPGGLSAGAPNTEAENPDVPFRGPRQVPPEFLPGVGGPASTSLPPIPSRLFGLDSMVMDEAGSRSRDSLAVIRLGNASASSFPRNLGETSSCEASGWEASGLSSELDSQDPGPTRTPAPVAEKAATEPRVAAASQSLPASTTPLETEAETPPMAGQEESRMAELDNSRRVPGPASATPRRTSLNDSQNATSRDAENSESDGQAPRVLPTEKLAPIQLSHGHADVAADGVLFDRPIEPAGALQARSKIAAPQPPQAPMVSPEVETTSAIPSQPIRQISLRLAGTASAQVDVQVEERAGSVQVAVRTADPDLAKSLQINLGDLMGRLEENGFKTAAWTPATAQHSGGAVREVSTSANSQSHSDDSGFTGGQQNSQHGQRESNQRQPERWQAQLNETLGALNKKTYAEEKP